MDGLRNREIGERLHISEGTVKLHLHNIYEKLGVGGRMELSNYVKARGVF
jgi:two-component system nitrate/nitrite response regulator NarP